MSNRVDVILAYRCISDRKRNVCTRIKIYFSNLPIRNYRLKSFETYSRAKPIGLKEKRAKA